MTTKITLKVTLISTLLLVCAISAQLAATTLSIEAQRALFKEAKKDFSHDDYSKYQDYKNQLEYYPLRPYLDYAYLRGNLKTTSHHQIKEFIANNDNTPLAKRMRYLWLKKLARTNADTELIEHFYPTADVALECSYRAALLRQNKADDAFDNIEKLWIVGHSQPKACDAVFKAWKETGAITPELTWRRIELAMQGRQLKLARYLARSLSKEMRNDFKLWDRVNNKPTLVNSSKLFSNDNPRHHTILAYGFRRLAFKDLDHAIESWEALQEKYTFTLEDKAHINRTLGLLIGQNHRDEALPHLNAFDPKLENKRIREWRIRAALRERDWPSVLATIGWLTDEEKNEPRWLYWRARALDELGFGADANTLYQQLADERGYHAFLAADHLDLPYSFENTPATVDAEQIHAIAAIPAIVRAKELLELDRLIEARREWEFISRRLTNTQLLAAAKLAENWQWHSSAIFTAARIAYWDDIPLRFPLGHKNAVIYQANKFEIEPEWVYGIMRQESAFVTDARSNKGALGLMQLLPSTGRYIAKKNETRYSGSFDLLRADKNIKLGSAYLKNVRSRLYDHPVLATAAYNAGYTRVKRWLPDNDTNMDADIWIETIPYDETRDYLERVLSYTAIYGWRLNPNHQNSLVGFMTPVGTPGTIATQSQNKTTAAGS